MIIKEYGKCYLECDICNEEVEKEFKYFDEIVDYKKQNGWKSKKINGEWVEICPICQGV